MQFESRLAQDQQFINRAQAEGLTIISGNIWYENPEGLNGSGEQFSGVSGAGYLTSLDGQIEAVGMDSLTHLKIKVDGKWLEACISLGQVLNTFNMPVKRYSDE